jgi:hypothetical protein
MNIEMMESKAFRTFLHVHSLFKSERLTANIKATLHTALIKSIMTCDCPAWQFAADTKILRLQRLQNKVPRTVGNFSWLTSFPEVHVAFNIPYVYDFI